MRVATLVLVVGAVVGGVSLLGRDAPAVHAAPAPEAASEQEVRAVAAALVALATLPPPAEEPRPQDPFGLEAARAARDFLVRRPQGFRDDCSGYVSAIFSEIGVPMDHVVSTLWDEAVEHDALHWEPLPQVGDLVFFDDTTDRNRNGAWDDALTHVGLVLDVEPDGTVVFAHSGTSAGRSVARLNLERPSVHEDEEGRVLNHWLREPRPGDPPTASYLTGELFSAYATVRPDQDWL